MIIKDELKGKILILLLRHEGKANAITAKELARIFDMKNDRKVRACIAELIEKDGIPVASLIDPPYGYYIIESRREAEDYMRTLRNRIKETCVRRAQFKRATYLNLNSLVQGKLL